MEKLRPENGAENFKLTPENKGNLSEHEIELAEQYIEERKNNGSANNESAADRPVAADDIKKLFLKYGKSEEETDKFAKFIDEKSKKPINRRNFLKAAGAVIGITAGVISYKYLKENFNGLWAEFQETTENNYEIEYSEEMTALYKELEKYLEEDINYEKVNKNLDGISTEFKHAEFIKNSNKKEIDEMIDSIIANDNDILLFGEFHGVDSNAVSTVQILEKIKTKNNKKISKIALEFLDFNDPESVKLTEKFNNKQISVQDFYLKNYFQSNIKPLLEFAQINNIPIEGLESENGLDTYSDLMDRAAKRAVIMSVKAGSLAQEKSSNNTIVIFSGAAHSSKSGYEEKKGHNYLPQSQTIEFTTQESVVKAMEKNYTFKEYLEKLGFKPTVIKLEDMNHQAQVNNNNLGYTYNFLKEEDTEKFSEQWKKEWQNYKLDRKDPFIINSSDEKNSYLIINPSEVPNTPPALNVFKEIKKKFIPLHKMIRKISYVSYEPYKYEMSLLTQTEAPISAKLADINLENGKIKKLYLPEQLKEN